MKPAVRWTQVAADGEARSGVLHTPHGEVETPAFMPVGTRGAVRTVDGRDLRELSAAMLLANTYHLMLRPGAATIAGLGGLHGFMAWQGPILTDSGGFQVFSLEPDVSETGVLFRSTYDGSRVELTPESAMSVQEQLGPDIAMALDVLVGLPADRTSVEHAMELTLRWAKRTVAARSKGDQGVFGIVQGGTDVELRARSAAATADLGFDGFGLGGFSVGEPDEDRGAAMDAALAELPRDKARYAMGIGDTEGVLDAIARGVDLFDCVLPTRLARHGKVLHPDGDFSIKRSEWAGEEARLDGLCGCATCDVYSRGYLRHLFKTKEPLGPRLMTIHNLWYTLRIVSEARSAVAAGNFETFRRSRVARRKA